MEFNTTFNNISVGHLVRDRIVVGLQLPVQSVPITTSKVASLNTAHGNVYSIQHYVIKFVSDLQRHERYSNSQL
jgi:hypothetical protein